MGIGYLYYLTFTFSKFTFKNFIFLEMSDTILSRYQLPKDGWLQTWAVLEWAEK